MTLTPLAEAQALVLAGCPPLAPTTVPLGGALGCVTAAAVAATEAVPPFDNTAMDGYAVRAADTARADAENPVVLEVAGTFAAGSRPDLEVVAGRAVRIMTGAPMPPGADAVVMVERTEAVDDGRQVAVGVAVEPGDHVRRVGDDVLPGEGVGAAGPPLRAGPLRMLASVGVTEVAAHPRPRVGVLSTGDKLVDRGGPLAPGQIRDSNRVALLASLAEAGWVPVDLGLVADDLDAITGAVTDGAARCDALLTSGGVSVGDFDHVKAVLAKLGAMRWLQIAIKPAKPFAFGTIASPGRPVVPVFGLPGNPVSSLVSFEVLARPALRQMAGHHHLDRLAVRAVADEPLGRRPDGKTHFVRAVVTLAPEGRLHVRSAGSQGSHQLSAMAAANALAVLPDGTGVLAGSEVETMIVGELPSG